MRSYQYNAANAISDKVAKTDWKSNDKNLGKFYATTKMNIKTHVID